MAFEIWLAFAFASTVVLIIPGPTVMLVVSYALGRGKHTGWATVPGVALGDLTAMTASLLGAGAVLAASATAFTALKLIGAAYLIWLAIGLWRARPVLDGVKRDLNAQSNWSMFWNAYIVTALNPKSIVFFVAFVPQFIDPARSPWIQFAVLEVTFVTLATLNVALWAVLAGKMRTFFRNPGTLRYLNRIGAGFLVGAAMLTAVLRPNS